MTERKKTGSAAGVIFGILTAWMLMYVMLTTAVDIVAYHTPGYFEREYEKYDVLSSLPEMTMSEEDGLMAVTNHMMRYLKGYPDAPQLQIEVMMGGERRGFFTERELLHMEDCRNIFVAAQKLRIAALVGALLCTLLCALLIRPEERFLGSFGTGLLSGTALSLAGGIFLGIAFAKDFDHAFVTFHHILFDNDLWLLDPSVDMLVNIVPEGFFYDTALRIIGIFLIGTVLLIAAAVIMKRRAAGKRR